MSIITLTEVLLLGLTVRSFQHAGQPISKCASGPRYRDRLLPSRASAGTVGSAVLDHIILPMLLANRVPLLWVTNFLLASNFLVLHFADMLGFGLRLGTRGKMHLTQRKQEQLSAWRDRRSA